MNEKNHSMICELRHRLHRHPELSLEERWTQEHLMAFLKAHTHLDVVPRGKWFYAKYTSGSSLPGVLFRAELDALPVEDMITADYASEITGHGHKCGHDGHMASLCGLALELEEKGADRDVYLVFQHGEEIGAGGAECAKLITEEGIGFAYGWHNRPGMPKGMIQTMDSTMYYASKGMILHFDGLPSHASMPEKGRCPAFAISKIVSAIPDLVAPEHWDGEVFCTVIQVDVGEPAFGTQASRGELLLTIRGQYEREMDQLQAKLEEMAATLAEKDGLTWNVRYCDEFPESANSPVAAQRIRDGAKRLGFAYREAPHPYRGSDDFGYYPKLAEGAMFEVGAGEECAALHTYGYDFPDDILPVAVDVMWELTRG
ncbi:MAG: amidohydrolase [Clostridia bacterium]|nr:amidohydrolase [Clostridia bacterium]